MKTDFQLSVPTPCREKWEQFKPTHRGAFCGSCQKEVIDFTRWTETEIKQYFRYRAHATCGRFRPQQLKLYREVAAPSGWWSSLAAFVLLMLSKPTEAQPVKQPLVEHVDYRFGNRSETDTSKGQMVVRGRVFDATDQSPIPGANIMLGGTAVGTVSGAEGDFELCIREPGDSIRLVVSFIGYETRELVLPRATSYETEVKLALDVSVLGGITVGGVVRVSRYSPRRIWWKLRSLARGW